MGPTWGPYGIVAFDNLQTLNVDLIIIIDDKQSYVRPLGPTCSLGPTVNVSGRTFISTTFSPPLSCT